MRCCFCVKVGGGGEGEKPLARDGLGGKEKFSGRWNFGREERRFQLGQ